MLNIWAQFWSKVETLKNQFEQWSGRFVVPELPVKMGPRIQADKKKQRHNKKTITTRYPTLLSAERSFLGRKKEDFFLFFCLGLLAFLWPKTSKDHSATKHYKIRGSVVFFVVFSFIGVSQTRTKTTATTIKTITSNKTTTMGPRNQEEQKKQETPQKRRHQTNQKKHYKTSFFVCCSFFGCGCPNNQNNKTTIQQNSQKKNKNKRQETLENKVILFFLLWVFWWKQQQKQQQTKKQQQQK